MLPDFLDCADVGMIQGRGRADLTLKTLQVTVTGDGLGEKLQRGLPAQLLPGPEWVSDGHRGPTELPLKSVETAASIEGTELTVFLHQPRTEL
jgi:hypothetical protein